MELRPRAFALSLKQRQRVDVMRNIDVTPTVLEILGVAPAPTVDGEVIAKILHGQGRRHWPGHTHGPDCVHDGNDEAMLSWGRDRR